MVSVTLSPDKNALRQIHRVQALTIAWMNVEAAASLVAAWKAHSPALLAFGGHRERRAVRVAGILLFVLAGYVTVISAMALLGYSEPAPSYACVAILSAAATIMPWLAKQKRKLSAATGSAALRAGAAQSGLCAYLSAIAIVGLAVNAIWHVSCADSIAITPLVLWEGKEAVRGKPCDCAFHHSEGHRIKSMVEA